MEYLNNKGKEVAENYYEGTFQLRDVSKKVIDKALELIEKNNHIFIAEEIKLKKGIDWKVSSQKIMQIIAKELQKLFGGEIKISRKLFSQNRLTSKMVYRITVLFRMSKFKVGDIVKAGARMIEIKRLGSKVEGVDVDSGKRISVSYDRVH